MSNHSASWKTLASSGRIALGALVILASGGHIIGALLTGKAKLLWLMATFADRPVLFVVLLAAWTFILVGGVTYIVPGVNELRAGARQPLPEK